MIRKELRLYNTEHGESSNQWAEKFRDIGGIDIKVTRVSWEVMHDPMTKMLASGGAIGDIVYDIVYTFASWTAEFHEYYTPLNEMPFAEVPPEVERDMLPYAKAAVTYNGVCYGMPRTVYPMIMAYNQEMWQQHGLKEPTDPNYSYEDWLKAIGKLTRIVDPNNMMRNRYGFLCGYAPGFHHAIFIIFVHLNGGRLYDEAGKPLFDSSECIAAVKDLITLKSYMPPEAVDQHATFWTRNFVLNGVCASCIDFTQFIKRCRDPAQSKVVGKIKAAIIPGHGSVVRSGSVDLSEGFSILKNSKRKEDAWKFMMFTTTRDYQVYQATPEAPTKLDEGVPCYWSMYDDPRIKDFDEVRASKEQLKYRCDRYGRVYDFKLLVETLEPSLWDAYKGKRTPEEALKKAQEKAKALVKEEKERYPSPR